VRIACSIRNRIPPATPEFALSFVILSEEGRLA
jgi:hypothetical protein